MRAKMENSPRLSAKCAGSLCGGDISQIAYAIYKASLHGEITVWSDANVNVQFDRVDCSPVIDPQYLAGTYGMGAQLSDIESDLKLLQRERVPAAILL